VNILTFRDHQISQRADGFVNATQMAQANDVRLNKYFENESTTKYLEALWESICPENGVNGELVVVSGFGADKATWMHPLAAIHFAQWISPAFHVWCNRHIKTLIETGETIVAEVIPTSKQETRKVQICPAIKAVDLSTLTFGQLKRLFYFRCSIDDTLGPLDGLVYDIDPNLWAADATSISLAYEKLCLEMEERSLEWRKKELAEAKRMIRLRKKDMANLRDGKVSRLFPDFGRHYERPTAEAESLWMIEVDR
jgi:KilA-N domain